MTSGSTGQGDADFAAAVTRAVERYRQSRAEGRPVGVDDVLDLPRDRPDFLATRAAVIRAIAASEPASHPSLPTSGEPGELPRIEGYDLVGCLGRGGMGVVYEAYQQATGRRVAVKFLLDAAVAGEAARQRFEREVEVVAGLQHPGIVSIIDSGVRRGRYFYVMEYVEGRPLDQALPPGRADLRRSLELLIRVCEAVDYAHQRGVLHRDLKPSNILVDPRDQPHLLDFGLAKRVETPGGARPQGLALTMSEPGQLLGTVAYMSPEQSLGRAEQASVRTDIYSLGVIAYELVTGSLPVQMEGSLRDVLARIAEQDPPPPSSRRRGVSRDLDAVLLRALEKSPQRRYATAGELAAELGRVLRSEPVLARRVGPLGRAWRWSRRHRALAITGAAGALVLAVVSAVLIARIIEERDRANAHAAENLRNFQRAQQALLESRRNERYARENFALLRGILESADPERQGEPTVRHLLDTAAARLDASPPELDLTEASIREILGSVYRKFGDYDRAEAHLSRALQIRMRHPGDDAALAECLHHLAAALWWKGEYERAEEHYTRSLDLRRRLHPGDHRDTATSLTHLAACRLRLGRLDDARRLYEEALQMRQRLLGPEHEEVAQSLNNLAKCSLEAEDFDTAEALFRQALDMIRRIRGDQYAGTAAASQNLAACLFEKGDLAGAREAYARAVDIRTALYRTGHHLTAGSMIGLAQVELALGAASEAERLARSGLNMYEQQGRTSHPDYAEALAALALVLARTDRCSEAEPMLRRAIAILAGAPPVDQRQLATIEGRLGECLTALGRLAEAEAVLLESHRRIVAIRGPGSRAERSAAQRLERLYTLAGNAEQAARYRPAPR